MRFILGFSGVILMLPGGCMLLFSWGKGFDDLGIHSIGDVVRSLPALAIVFGLFAAGVALFRLAINR